MKRNTEGDTLYYMYNGHGDVTALLNDSQELMTNGSFDTTSSGWSFRSSQGAFAIGERDTSDYSSAPAGYKITCITAGSQPDNIQLFTMTGNYVKITAGKQYKLTFRAKSDGGNITPTISLMKRLSPGTAYDTPKEVAISGTWETYTITFTASTTDDAARITFYLGGMPAGSTLHIDSVSFKEATESSGNVRQTYYYDAFGNITEQSGDVDNNITYAGYQYDKETGLYYLNARMYDPKVARFLQEDTYTGDEYDPLSLNLYTYCVNNPIMYTDPTGHACLAQEEAARLIQQLYDYRSDTKYHNDPIEQRLKDVQQIYKNNNIDFTASDSYKDLQKIQNSGSTSDYLSAVATATIHENVNANLAYDYKKGTNNFSKYVDYQKADLNVNFNAESGKIICQQGWFKIVISLPRELYSDSKDGWMSTDSRRLLMLQTIVWLQAQSKSQRDLIISAIKEIRKKVSHNKVGEWAQGTFANGMNNLFGGSLAGMVINGLTGKSSLEEISDKYDQTKFGCLLFGSAKTVEPGTVRVFRVEGGINERITIGKNGEVVIQGKSKTLFLNFGDEQRAMEFLQKRLSQGMSDATIKSFEVPKSFVNKIRTSAVLESEASKFPGRPILVDVTKAGDQYGLRSKQILELENNIINKSGKISVPKEGGIKLIW